MPNYKIGVSKDGKRYSIIFKADSELLARDRVHKEGYSILSVEEVEKKEELGNIFIFEGIKDGDLKKGKIVGDDIFKVYVKLRKNLEYDVKILFDTKDKDLSLDKKQKIITNLEDEYKLFYSTGRKEKIDELREKLEKEKNEKKNLDSFFLKKELEDTNKLLAIVLVKIENLLNGKTGLKIEPDKIELLKNIYNEIIKLKKSTNISKLKQIAEIALIKIGKIELDDIENNKNIETRDLLKETNKLLRSVGSKNHFTEKNKDINYQINFYLSKIKDYFNNIKTENKKNEIDKESHSYIKNLLFLSRYKQRLKENTNYILKNAFKLIFDKNIREDVFLKRSVIKQNIILLSAKQKGVNYSYTYAKKGINKINDVFKSFILDLKNYLFFVIFIYFIIFSLFLTFGRTLDIQDIDYYGIVMIIITIISYFLLYLSKNIFIFFINFVFFFFVVIFGVINF